MTDTPETLQAALADLQDRHTEAMKSLAKWSIDVDSAIARVAAFEKARVEAVEEEPHTLHEGQIDYLETGGYDGKLMVELSKRAARRLRYCERELARLREGLKVSGDDVFNTELDDWASATPFGYNVQDQRHYVRERLRRMAREIQRHRALLKDGGGK